MENVVFYKQKERKKEGESEVRQRIRIHKAETNKGAADFHICWMHLQESMGLYV